MTRTLFAAVMLTLVACGGKGGRGPTPSAEGVATSTATEAPAWVRGEMPEPYDASTHMMVVGQGKTYDAALLDARDDMALAVLGPTTVRPFAAIPDGLQDFAFAPATERFEDADGTTHVRLIAQRVFVMDRLRAWEALTGVGALSDEIPEAFRVGGKPVTDPSEHLMALATTLAYQRASAFVCERSMVVNTSTCTPADLGAIRSAVSTFGQSLKVTPWFDGGVPYRPGLGHQAPVAVEVQWTPPQGQPARISGVPVVFEASTDSATEETDDRGRARWSPSAVDPAVPVSAKIGAADLLGPESSLWATLAPAAVGFRTLAPKTARIAWMVKETGRGRTGRRGFVARAKRLGLHPPVDLPKTLATLFADPKQPPSRDAMRAAATDAAGRFDLVAVGEMHSQFAGKMGARSVWHEARGALYLYDVWTGARVGPLRGTARASAIGERAASSKARELLGSRWAADAAKMLDEHYRSGASARR